MKSLKFVLIFCVISILPSYNLSAQGSNNNMLLDVLDPNQLNQDLMYNKDAYETIIGSPFLFDTWSNGKLVGTSGKEFPNITLKYDAYGDRIIIKKEDELIALDKEIVTSFTFNQNGESFIFKSLKNLDKGAEDRYVHVIYDKDIKLYEVISKKLTKGGAVNNGYNATTVTRDKFVDKNTTFIKVKDKAPMEIKKNKKGFQSAFPKHQDKIKSFVKQNKIDFKLNSDIIKLLTYVGELM